MPQAGVLLGPLPLRPNGSEVHDVSAPTLIQCPTFDRPANPTWTPFTRSSLSWPRTSARQIRSGPHPTSSVPRSSAQPAAYALVAEAGDEIVGFALYFRNFSTWEGVHGIYLEDLYVKPEHRGAGHGRALLSSLAALAVERGYARLEWAVLDWNQPSITFYRNLGALPLDEWTVYRLSGDPLLQVAQEGRDKPA